MGAREWGFSRISVLITDEGTNLRKEEETVGGGKRRNCVDGRDNGCCSAVWVRLSFFFSFSGNTNSNMKNFSDGSPNQCHGSVEIGNFLSNQTQIEVIQKINF